jgi:hypothetical protein
MKSIILFLLLSWATSASSFVSSNKPVSFSILKAKKSEAEDLPLQTNQVVSKVAVAGATGRTGSLVVEELLKRNVQVVAMVRDKNKASETFPNPPSSLSVVECDLTNEKAIDSALEGCDAVVWCATGFSNAETTLLERLKKLIGVALAPKQSIDAVGIPFIAKSMLKSSNGDAKGSLPKVVMLSSAGVTRPSWSETKKEQLMGSADIPIVRLNPFGILDIKAVSEEKLRQTGTHIVLSFV